MITVATTTTRAVAALVDLVPLTLVTISIQTSMFVSDDASWRSSPWNAIDGLVDLINRQPSTVLGPLGLFIALFVLWSVTTTAFLGATPGQRLVGLVVVTSEGRKPSVIRTAIHATLAVCTSLTLGLGPLWSVADPARRTLYDRLGGVLVIREP